MPAPPSQHDQGDLLDQGFPFYYSMSAPFVDANGDPSGAAGAVAELTRELNNFPHIFYGVRLRNVYPLPLITLADEFAAARLLDDDQVVEIDLAQQNITAQVALQDAIQGGKADRAGTPHWHPFPHPYLMAGANEIRIVVRRLTGYPDLAVDTPVLPICRATLVTAVFRKGLRMTAPARVEPPR